MSLSKQWADSCSEESLSTRNLVALEKGKDEKESHRGVIYMKWFLIRPQSIMIQSSESLAVFMFLGKCEVFQSSSES
jgi:hypothetical protein